MRHLVQADTLITMLVCTLAGGFGRHGNTSSRQPNASSSSPLPLDSCPSPAGNPSPACEDLDASILPLHLLVPWISTLSTLVVLSMPTILLRSKGKEAGLRRFAAALLRFLAMLGSVSLASNAPLTVRFVFSVYACVRVLVISTGEGGEGAWWGLRYTSVVGLLAWQLFHGPPVSLMAWPASGLGQGSLHCAYLAHLVGCVGPGIVLTAVQCVIGFATFVDIREA
jgi:hypothetical protein